MDKIYLGADPRPTGNILPPALVTRPLFSIFLPVIYARKSRANGSGGYIFINVEEEAIITSVQQGPKTSVSESLKLDELHVTFQVLRRFKYEDKLCKATLKNPWWLFDLQPSAPLDGYMMEHGKFSASLSKDGRITEGLKVTVEVTEL